MDSEELKEKVLALEAGQKNISENSANLESEESLYNKKIIEEMTSKIIEIATGGK